MADAGVSSNADEVRRTLRQLARMLERPGRVHRRVARAYLAFTKLSFRSGQDPFGVPWRPISNRQGKPLRDTGLLANSITSDGTDDDITLGTNVSYAAAHQFGKQGTENVKAHERRITQAFGRRLAQPLTVRVGAHTRQANLAARPFFPTGDEIPTTWLEALEEEYEKELDRIAREGARR